MDLGDLLAHDGVIASLKVSSKKELLQALSERAAAPTGLSSSDIFTMLLQREGLGSTGLGRGVAIPHVKLKQTKSIVCYFARLASPVNFESADGDPVDLVFLLLAPEHAGGDHLKALARISRLVREPATLESLRKAPDQTALRRILTTPVTSHAA